MNLVITGKLTHKVCVMSIEILSCLLHVDSELELNGYCIKLIQ